jgi:hypothetical protein
MTDIVERLRDWSKLSPVIAMEAADEIERLRKEEAAWRKAAIEQQKRARSQQYDAKGGA